MREICLGTSVRLSMANLVVSWMVAGWLGIVIGTPKMWKPRVISHGVGAIVIHGLPSGKEARNSDEFPGPHMRDFEVLSSSPISLKHFWSWGRSGRMRSRGPNIVPSSKYHRDNGRLASWRDLVIGAIPNEKRTGPRGSPC